VVNISFFLSGTMYMMISSLGFLTFGENSSGFILDNYSNRDRWASASRLGVAFSVLFAYPLVFLGAREGWVALMASHNDDNNNNVMPTTTDAVPNRKLITVIILVIVTALAIFVPNLTFVLSFAGATLSSCVIYIFPSVMFQALDRTCTCLLKHTSKWEMQEAVTMMWLGVVLGACGAVVSVVRAILT
jgi:amino acid permease